MFLIVISTFNQNIKVQNKYLGYVLSVWCLLFGLRHESVGNDSSGYATFFEGNGSNYMYGTINNPVESIEWGFVEISRYLHYLSNNYTFFFFVVSLIFTIPMYFYYKDKKCCIWSLLLFIVMSKSFFGLPVMMRQTMSIGLVLTSILLLKNARIVFDYKYIIQNKKIIFGVALFVLSIFVHRTSLILFPLLLGLYFIRINKKICYIVVFMTFAITMLNRELISNYFDLMLSFVGGFSDSNINLLQARYEDDFTARDFGLVRASAWTLTLLLSVWSTKMEDINKYNFKCLVFAFVLYMLLGTSSMGLRISVIFQIIGFSVIVPQTIHVNKRSKILFAILTLAFIVNSYSNFEKWSIETMDSGLPYYFFWEKN